VGALEDTDRETQREPPEGAVAEIDPASASLPVRIGARRDVRALTVGAVLGLQRSSGKQASCVRPRVARVPVGYLGTGAGTIEVVLAGLRYTIPTRSFAENAI
jgi:hypothetical protein